MRFRWTLSLSLILFAAADAAPLNRVLVVSIDGLDNRYLRNRDAMNLKIPNLRRLIQTGQYASQGVVGVVPTVTWPSHTTMITGVRPFEHGIRGNRRPKEEGGDYYWSPSLLKVKPLWHEVKESGGTTAAITWPVTLDAGIDFNLPEFFRRRNGGAMDFEAISEKATPGLVDKIRKRFPSFGTQWMDDRARTQATVYLLESERPNLILLHLVDLDSEQHDRGPFTSDARAMLEYTDELLGQILKAAGRNYTLVITSDHGFEQIDFAMNPVEAAAAEKVKLNVKLAAGLALAMDNDSAAFFRARRGVGREVSRKELGDFAPELVDGVVSAFEPADHHVFTNTSNEPFIKVGRGEHGLWPGRENYRSVLIVSGSAVRSRDLATLSLSNVYSRLRSLLGLGETH